MSMNRKKCIALLLSLTLLLGCMAGLTACGQKTPDPVKPEQSESGLTEHEKPEKPDEPAEPERYPDPLTGEPMEKPYDNARPYAVMINNIKMAIPSRGISKASIIYEVLAEGGVTRMMAIFPTLEDVDDLGSLRSIRPYYASIAKSYDAIAVHAGGSEQSYKDMSSFDIDHLDGVLGSYASGTFYRDKTRISRGFEHSLFGNGPLLMAYAEKKGYSAYHAQENRTYSLSFAEDGTPAGGSPAKAIEINFSGYKTMTMKLSEDGLYRGMQYGGDWIDETTGEPLSFTNIVVLYAATSVLDSAGRLSVTLTGSGDGYFACGGKYTEITWSRDSVDDSFSYALKDGTPLSFGVGKTYIAIVPTGSSITFE